MFCLSKALGAPVGSMLVGPAEADRQRAVVSQASRAAACGRRACSRPPDSSRLEQTPALLAQDHSNAKLLAKGLRTDSGHHSGCDRVQTNIVIFDIAGTGFDSGSFSAALEGAWSASQWRERPLPIRMVTHYDVTESMCRDAIEAAREVRYQTAAV